MKLIRTLSSMSWAASLAFLAAAPAAAQITAPDSVLYALASPPSQFEWGCFGPCACPILIQSPLTGSFALRRSHVDPLYAYYDVLDVRWRVPGSTRPVTITGSGTYRRGGEVASMQELTLDLSFDGGPIQHFTSGLEPANAPFPEIAARISLHDQVCLDSVLTVDAKPIGVAGVGGGSRLPSLAVSPNPFTSATEIELVLPRDGMVELGVFDLTGRRVSSIVDRQRLATGTYHRAWDGRRDGGDVAPPGVYMVRVDTPAGRTMRSLVKLR